MIFGKYINKYYKKYILLILLGVFAVIAVDYIQTLIPEYLGDVISMISINPNTTTSDILPIVKGMIFIGIIMFIGRFLWRICLFYFSDSTKLGLRHDMFLKAERLSQTFYHENKVGSIMSRFTNDLDDIEEFIGFGLVMIIDSLFLSILILYKMFKVNIILSLFTLFPIMFIVLWGLLVEKKMAEKWKERQDSFDKVYDFSQEIFTGIRVIKAFVKEIHELKAFSKVAQNSADKNIEFAKTHITFDVAIEIIIGIIFALLNGFGGYIVYKTAMGEPLTIFNQVTAMGAGELVTFIGYFDNLIWPLIALGQIIPMRSRAKTALSRISEFLDEDEDIQNPKNATILNNIKGKITFNNFSFSYPKTSLHSLENVSLTINPGELVGVVGKIGSGKTTLVNSLLRIYNVPKGSILIDDYDIMDVDISSLREVIAYVPQDNFLFSDKIKNNISFSNREASYESLKAAARFAGVDENIESFEEKYDTMVGERGTTLSGGQKQRISIARAYMKDSPIMILDDSVSAVDTKTEEVILNNIREKRKGKTTILVASRVSTVSKLDKIIVLNNGKLEAFGTPQELLKTSKTYERMVYLQRLESEVQGE